MKNIFLLAVILSLSPIQAQHKNCFLEYYDMFNTRKANAVPDGMQNVVVTIRDTKENTCVTRVGQILVKDGKVVGRLVLKNSEGDYVKPSDKLHDNYSAPSAPLKADYTITNGMTANFLTKQMKVVNLFFIDYLKKPIPSLVEAPPLKK